jgi:hypothetical protein
MREIPIYRPEIWTFDVIDYEWVCQKGVFTNTMFVPMPDEDRAWHGVFLRTVKNGASPAFTIRVPDAWGLVAVGTATKLQRTDGDRQKLQTAIGALIWAKRCEEGFELVTSSRPSPDLNIPARPLPSIVRPAAIAAGPFRQLSMF